jgi:hypothetical protein
MLRNIGLIPRGPILLLAPIHPASTTCVTTLMMEDDIDILDSSISHTKNILKGMSSGIYLAEIGIN